MKTTIDRAGRVVIPKALRDAMGVGEGVTVDMQVRDGRLEVEIVSPDIHLVEHDDGPVATSDEPLTPLDADAVRSVLESVRR